MKQELIKHMVGVVASSWVPVVVSQDYVELIRHIYCDQQAIVVRMKVAPANKTIQWTGDASGSENLAAVFAGVLAEASRVSVVISNIINIPEA